MQVDPSTYGKTLADIQNPGTQQTTTSPALGQQDFLKLMVAQMENQNPLEPQDNTQMIAQLASFQTLSAMEEMSNALKTLAQVSQLSSASMLVGRTVKASVPQTADPTTGMPRANQDINGVVDNVTFDSSGATVHIGNQSVPATLVQEVS
jgi:flagellar basal-body rod modification protein FlgD